MFDSARVRSFSYMLSAGINFLLEDPIDFITKCSLRFGVDKYFEKFDIWQRVKHGEFKSDSLAQVQLAVDRGELSEAVNQIQSLGKIGQLIHSRKLARIRSTQDLLKFRFEPYSRISHKNTGQPNILYIITNSLPDTRSGYTRRTQSLMFSLLQGGIRISAVTRLGYPAVIGRLKSVGMDRVGDARYFRIIPYVYRTNELRRAKLAAREIVRIAKVVDASILHTTTDFRNAIPTYLAAKELEIPWIYEVRGELESSWAARTLDPESAVLSEYYRKAQELETQAMVNADAVLTLSQVSQERISRRGIPKEKLATIPNSVDSIDIKQKRPLKSDLRRELGLPDGLILGTVTSVVSYEGLDFVIEALAEELSSKYFLVIVGQGSALPKLKRLAKELGVESRVLFAGEVNGDDAWKWYASFDVFIVPRKNIEVCRVVTPLKPVLAQALGVPVVATDLPALREACAGNGFLFKPDHKDDFWRAVRDSLDSENTLRGIAWAKQRTWEQTSKRLIEVYNGVRMRTS